MNPPKPDPADSRIILPRRSDEMPLKPKMLVQLAGRRFRVESAGKTRAVLELVVLTDPSERESALPEIVGEERFTDAVKAIHRSDESREGAFAFVEVVRYFTDTHKLPLAEAMGKAIEITNP